VSVVQQLQEEKETKKQSNKEKKQKIPARAGPCFFPYPYLSPLSTVPGRTPTIHVPASRPP
jgi:hypothetical protein